MPDIEHSPAPWMLDAHGVSSIPTGRRIVRVERVDTRQGLVDANLIKAAPVMYAALIKQAGMAHDTDCVKRMALGNDDLWCECTQRAIFAWPSLKRRAGNSMADIALAVSDMVRSGMEPVYRTSWTTADRYLFANTGHEFLLIKQGTGTSTVTVLTYATQDGLDIADQEIGHGCRFRAQVGHVWQSRQGIVRRGGMIALWLAVVWLICPLPSFA